MDTAFTQFLHGLFPISIVAFADVPLELLQLLVEELVFAAHLLDVVHGMHDRRMVAAAELAADARERGIRHGAAKVHGDLPRHGDVLRPLFAQHVLHLDFIMLADVVDDHFGSDIGMDGTAELLQHPFRRRLVDVAVHQRRIGDDACQYPLHHTHIAFYIGSDQLDDLVRQTGMLCLRLLPQDRDPRLQVRGLDIDRQAIGEPRAQPVLQLVQILWRPVARNDDLLVRFAQRIEGVEKLLLGPRLVLQELDVVDDQAVDGAVLLLEFHDGRILDGIVRIVMMLGGAFLGVFLPSASKVVATHNQNAQNQIAYQGTKFISIAICFCCFGMMSVSTEMLTAYVGRDYLYLTIWLDIWLLATLGTHNQAISSLILAGSDIRAITYSTIVASIIGLLLTWFLIPLYDVGATVLGYFVYCMIQILFYYLYYWPRVMKIDSVRVFFSSFFPYVLAGGIICFGLREIVFESLNIWVSLIFKGGLFSIAFAVITFSLLGKDDKQFIKQLIHK